MDELPINFSEQLSKPVDEIESDYIRHKIESLGDDPRVSELKLIKKLVDVEISLLDEGSVQLEDIVEDKIRRRGMEFSVARGLDDFSYFDGEYKDAIEDRTGDGLPKNPENIQSEIVAKAIIEYGIDSDRAEGLTRTERRVLGEKETRDGFPRNSFSRMLSHFGLSRKYRERVNKQLNPEEYE